MNARDAIGEWASDRAVCMFHATYHATMESTEGCTIVSIHGDVLSATDVVDERIHHATDDATADA